MSTALYDFLLLICFYVKTFYRHLHISHLNKHDGDSLYRDILHLLLFIDGEKIISKIANITRSNSLSKTFYIF